MESRIPDTSFLGMAVSLTESTGFCLLSRFYIFSWPGECFRILFEALFASRGEAMVVVKGLSLKPLPICSGRCLVRYLDVEKIREKTITISRDSLREKARMPRSSERARKSGDEWSCGFRGGPTTSVGDQPSNLRGFFFRRSPVLLHGVLHFGCGGGLHQSLRIHEA